MNQRRGKQKRLRDIFPLLLIALGLSFGVPDAVLAQAVGLEIVSPLSGTTVAPGDTISVVVSVDSRRGFLLVSVIGEDIGITDFQRLPPAPFSLTVPLGVIGKKQIQALGITGPERGIFSDPVTLDIETDVMLTALQANLLTHIFILGSERISP